MFLYSSKNCKWILQKQRTFQQAAKQESEFQYDYVCTYLGFAQIKQQMSTYIFAFVFAFKRQKTK